MTAAGIEFIPFMRLKQKNQHNIVKGSCGLFHVSDIININWDMHACVMHALSL